MEAQQPKLNRESLLHEYEIGTLLYIYDDELRWSRFTTLTAMHGAVLAGWLSIMNDSNNFLFRVLPLFGLVLSWMMFANLQRATAHFAYRDGRMKWIEEQLTKDGAPDEFRSYRDRHPVTDLMLYGRLKKYSQITPEITWYKRLISSRSQSEKVLRYINVALVFRLPSFLSLITLAIALIWLGALLYAMSLL